MADPITMALVASAVVGTAGAIQQGRVARAQGRTEQDILNFNAEQKLKEAEDAREFARSEADRFSEEGRRRLATARVSYARGGVLAEGTPAFALEEMAENLEADKMEILKQGFLTSSRAAVEATSLRLQGKAAKTRGKHAFRGSLLTGAGRLTSGFAQAGFVEHQLSQ